jgi:hypothetical protein
MDAEVELGEATNSSCSTYPRRQSCAAARIYRPAAPPAGRVRRQASPSIPHPRSHRLPGGRGAAAAGRPARIRSRAHLPGRQEEGIGEVDWIKESNGEWGTAQGDGGGVMRAERGSRRRALGISAFPEVGSFQMCGCESIRGRWVLANSLAGPSTAQIIGLLIHHILPCMSDT